MIEKNNIVIRAFEVLQKDGMIVLIKEFFSSIKLMFIIYPYAIIKIKIFRHNDLNDLIDFCFFGVAGLIRPLQVRSEILEMLKILNKKKPKVIIEIGTAGGGTLFMISRVASEDATIISVDLPGRIFGGVYPNVKEPLYKSFALPKQKIHLIRADSHNQATLARINCIVEKKGIDFLFIDGDHSYEGVKKDFEMYSSLVNDDGIIAFHDITVHPPEKGCEVNKFWDQIKEKYKYLEFINDPNQGCCGIGLLFMGWTQHKGNK